MYPDELFHFFPIANAGKNQTINLPKNWVILDGSESKDDQNITFWEWTQLQGPNNAGNILISRIFFIIIFIKKYFDFTNFFIISDILKSNFSKANATSLTKGSYLFQLKGAYLNPCKKYFLY